MNTLAMLSKVAKDEGYKRGQNAAEFRKANPEGAARIAELLKANIPAISREISSVLVRK